jgi:hypothetical protein
VPSDALLRRFADLHAAQQLHEGGGTTRLLVQARLLARQTSSEIAVRTGFADSVIDAYETVFFHCRDRLEAHDWVLTCAIGVRSWAEPKGPDPAAVLKAFAHWGGPRVLEAVQPYLLHGKDLFDPPLDLATPEGRREQVIRLTVSSQLHTWDTATDRKLYQLALLVHETDQTRRRRHPSTALLVQSLDFRLQEWADDAVSKYVEEAESAVRGRTAVYLRQPA